MSSLFRGEDMTLCQIYFQSEAAYSCIAQLGELGIVQFRDLNPSVNAFQRKFVNEVRRCEEMERKLRYLESEILKDKDIILIEPQEFCEAPKPKEMIDLETALEQLEHDLQEVNSNKDALKKNYLELQELRHILTKATHFFEEQDRIQANDGLGNTVITMEADRNQPLRLGFLAGVIDREKVPPFELMLWRICRGNVFLRTAEIEEVLEDPKSNTQVNKTVFILFFQGEQLKSKVKKICEGFKATIYPCPETASERREMGLGVMTRLEELKTVLDQSLNLRKSLLMNSAQNLKSWFCRVRKMKAIYHTMNLFNLEVNQKCLIAECWAPVSELTRIKLALDKGTELSGSNIQSILNRMETKEQPPTHHHLNKFTSGFQNIVDAYGIASYREFNPAPFTIITFPFLFAVMFGDSGHGLIMFLFGLFMVLRENQLKGKFKDNEVWQIFFGGRYIILLMAIFSIYTGIIYNDVFSKAINIFGSSWRVGVGKDFEFEKVTVLDLNPDTNITENVMFSGSSYPFGMDPVWAMAINKISFTNSLKMKFSVIIGIMQMTFGLVLSLLNHLFFGRRISVFFEFIPQIIFLTFIFVYLCLMIFIKWIKFSGSKTAYFGPQCAPNLLIELINMFFLKSAATDETALYPGCKALYPGQDSVQKILIILAVLCIPVMLLTKPLILYFKHKRKSQFGKKLADEGHVNPVASEEIDVNTKAKQNGSSNKLDKQDSHDSDEHDEEHFDMGEIAVEQCIHTIEFYLGCISHTASYLRLWALSLAHAELSEVLWTMVLQMGIGSKASYGFVMLWAVFAPWAVFTVGVLLLMEGLSAFLHALRLHWVEFQSKFYKGEGYQFIPFSFEEILAQAEQTEK